MIRRDYIQRLVEQAAASLKRMIGLRQEKKHEEAYQVLQAALRELINLDAKLVLALAARDLQNLLSIDESQAAGKGLVTADLLAEYAVTLESRGEGEAARELRLKAAELYRWVATKPGGKTAVEASVPAKSCLDIP